MRLHPSLRGRLMLFVIRTCSEGWVLPALLMLLASPAAAQTESKWHIEQRAADAARMLETNPRFAGMSPQQLAQHIEFVVGNTLFVLGHETGHALINELGIPILGHEENAADIFSTLMALKIGSEFSNRVLINTAKGWFLSSRRDRDEGVKVVYYDEHGLDLRRAYAIICLMVGSAPEKFAALAEEADMPEDRQGTCRGDYNNAAWSWEQVLKPRRRNPDQPKTPIAVTYGPGNGDYDVFVELSKKVRLLETTAEHLSEEYAWRVPIALEMQVCGESGARWELALKKVVVCYEILEEFGDLYRKYGHVKAMAEK
jgi:hypothetical protein